MQLFIIDTWRNVRVGPSRANWADNIFYAMHDLSGSMPHAVADRQAIFECDREARTLMDEQASDYYRIAEAGEQWPKDVATGKPLYDGEFEGIPVHVVG